MMMRPVKLLHFWLVVSAFAFAIRQWWEAANFGTSKETELAMSLLCLVTAASRIVYDSSCEESEAQQPPKQETIVLKRTTKLVVDDQGQQGKLSQRQLDEWLQARSPPAGIRPPRPVQIVHEYIRQHSVVVHGDTSREGHKYIMVKYACPHRAGNVLGLYLNQILLAVLANRTAVFQVANELECDPILQRAPWIPRLDTSSQHAKNRFAYSQRGALMKMLQEQLQLPRKMSPTWKDVDAALNLRNATAAILANDLSQHHVVELKGIVSGCFHSAMKGWAGRFDWNVPTCRDYVSGLFQDDAIDSNRAAQLFELGIDFVYGLLFRMSFDLTPDLLNSISYSHEIDSNAFSVGIHSRHFRVSDDGSNIASERKCIDRVLNRRPPNSTCQLLIMSDRPAATHLLQAYASEHRCEGVVVQRAERKADDEYFANTTGVKGWQISAEHGPYAGAGFYRDLALVSQARGALICSWRTSSIVIQQNFVYDSVMQYFERNGGSMKGYNSPEICHI